MPLQYWAFREIKQRSANMRIAEAIQGEEWLAMQTAFWGCFFLPPALLVLEPS